MAGLENEPSAEAFQEPDQLPAMQIAWRAATQEERPHRLRPAERRQFRLERFQVEGDPLVLTRDDGKVTVAAMVRAERHVHIRRPRPQPRGTKIFEKHRADYTGFLAQSPIHDHGAGILHTSGWLTPGLKPKAGPIRCPRTP